MINNAFSAVCTMHRYYVSALCLVWDFKHYLFWGSHRNKPIQWFAILSHSRPSCLGNGHGNPSEPMDFTLNVLSIQFQCQVWGVLLRCEVMMWLGQFWWCLIRCRSLRQTKILQIIQFHSNILTCTWEDCKLCRQNFDARPWVPASVFIPCISMGVWLCTCHH